MTIVDEVRSPALEPSGKPAVQSRPARSGGSVPTRIVDALGSMLLKRTSRRGFLATTAVTGAAMVAAPKTFALTPTSAYASICGDGASCSSGWTAFCCTINAGKNACPPGALAGGWWKADGSGYCCGSSKYIIDCHYRCSCGCSGSGICGSGCHPGSCTCAGGDCDNRRTNCNAFRYGQCNTHINCVGPVLCRVVTCTPPWRLDNCTTSAATDNRTGNHSSSCLPGPGCLTTIDQWWWDNGGPGNAVGNPTTPAVGSAPSGYTYRHFTNATVFHSAATGLVIVWTPFKEKYSEIGSWTSPLGLPTQNRIQGEGGGWLQAFQTGALYWLPNQTPVVPLWGEVQSRFVRLGDIRGLGWPIEMNIPVPGGARDITTNARIYTNGAGQSFVLSGAVLQRYIQQGETGGPLGFPVSGPMPTTLKQFAISGQGRTQTYTVKFQNGVITA